MTDTPPLESFQRATAATVKAMAGRQELEVAFTTEPPGVAGGRVKLPLPEAALPARDMDLVRGTADAAALRLRYHDPATHQKHMPRGVVAAMVFEALEQARCEALGMRYKTGVARNITALLARQCQAKNLSQVSAKAEAPL